eukprot:Awhi_evm1s3149
MSDTENAGEKITEEQLSKELEKTTVPIVSCCIQVSNVSPKSDIEKLKTFFGHVGEVVRALEQFS